MSSLRALLDARVPAAFSELRPYVPDPTPAAIRLDANEAPALLPTLSEQERSLWRDTLAQVEPARYPDARAGNLRAALTARMSVEPDQLVIGCGSDEVIAILLSTVARPIDGIPPAILIPTPTFVMYRVSARVHGYDVIETPLDADCDLDEVAMIDAIARRRPAVVFLATPNNPTSGVYDRGRVERIIEAAGRCDPPCVVVIDEAYLPFRLGPHDPWNGYTALDLLAKHDHVLVLRTLSKVGLAALRVGWAVARAPLAAEMEKVRLPYDLPALSQAGAVAALGPLSPAIERHVAAIVVERGRLLSKLKNISGLSIARADANFVWIELPRPAADVAAALKRDGVLVRSFPAYRQRMRVTVGTALEDDRFVHALHDILDDGARKAEPGNEGARS